MQQGGYGQPGWGGQAPGGGPPGYGAPPGAPQAAGGGAYEFTPDQDQKIGKLGTLLMVSGVLQIVWGLGQGVTSWIFGLAQWLYNAPISLALIIIGIMLLLAGGSFKKIRDTQGNDMGHLMDAVNKLSTATMVQIGGFVLAMLLGIVVVLLVAVLGVLAVAAS
jgi:hypothetical protein